jgi:hypothetical protein
MKREYNGGIGSNGLTSARHDVFNKTVARKISLKRITMLWMHRLLIAATWD